MTTGFIVVTITLCERGSDVAVVVKETERMRKGKRGEQTLEKKSERGERKMTG